MAVLVIPSKASDQTIPAQQEIGSLVILTGNSLKGSWIPITPENDYFKGKVATRIEIMELVWEEYPGLFKFVKCESNFNPLICNQQYGCSAGMGLIQVIPSSLRLCEKELGRELDPYDPIDNLDCGMVLLRIQGENAWFSSKQCWIKL